MFEENINQHFQILFLKITWLIYPMTSLSLRGDRAPSQARELVYNNCKHHFECHKSSILLLYLIIRLLKPKIGILIYVYFEVKTDRIISLLRRKKVVKIIHRWILHCAPLNVNNGKNFWMQEYIKFSN